MAPINEKYTTLIEKGWDGNILPVVVGPTGVGKTQWALNVARKWQVEIISADALLFYRGMDLGTAKPTRQERAEIPHWGIDLADPWEKYDVSSYQNYVYRILTAKDSKDKRFMVVGGSGFYIKAFFRQVSDQLEIPDGIKEEVEMLYNTYGLKACVEKLLSIQPAGKKIPDLDWNNPRRVLPALERCMASGLSLIELRNQFSEQTSCFEQWKRPLILLDREDEDLKGRLLKRIHGMLESGWEKEVVELLKTPWLENPAAKNALGYPEMVKFIQEGMSRDELMQSIFTKTWQLVKRQRRFYKSQLPTPETQILLSPEL